ncbi:MAG: hypothetical protein Q8880_08655 [Bacteroidota bacterium]|nr:hypothetical protein [Bacteroidota bacterium]
MRKNNTHIYEVVIYSVLFFLLGTKNSYAYIDPGAGSYILQIIIASFLGVSFAIKIYWKKVKTFISDLFKKNK